MSVSNNQLQIYISGSIGRCYMWSICPYRTKITIYSHRVFSLSRHKSLANYILNIHGIIIGEDCFKLIFPHIYTAIPTISTFGLLLSSK